MARVKFFKTPLAYPVFESRLSLPLWNIRLWFSVPAGWACGDIHLNGLENLVILGYATVDGYVQVFFFDREWEDLEGSVDWRPIAVSRYATPVFIISTEAILENKHEISDCSSYLLIDSSTAARYLLWWCSDRSDIARDNFRTLASFYEIWLSSAWNILYERKKWGVSLKWKCNWSYSGEQDD